VRDLGTLVILPGLGAARARGGRLVLTRKFLTGMQAYAERWRGRVSTLMHIVDEPSNNLDNVEVDPEALPFSVEPLRYGSKQMWERLRGAAVVLGGPDHRLYGLSRRLRALRVRSVYCTEYTLGTRIDWIRAETPNPLVGFKRALWELQNEWRIVRDLGAAHGVQCNGTPTYEAYRKHAPNALLYFDTRTPASGFATPQGIERRAASLRAGWPLRIAFSGRLLRAKGADHLVSVARWLATHGVRFEMTICGHGELVPELRAEIARHGLGEQVRLSGTLDFETELLPFLRDRIDLFVAPHLQGDPSCTYLETLACGVPIAAYANSAFAGILEQAPVGWSVPVGHPADLAKTIAKLDLRREEIIERSRAALCFALDHTFERTFDRRVEHLERLAAAT